MSLLLLLRKWSKINDNLVVAGNWDCDSMEVERITVLMKSQSWISWKIAIIWLMKKKAHKKWWPDEKLFSTIINIILLKLENDSKCDHKFVFHPFSFSISHKIVKQTTQTNKKNKFHNLWSRFIRMVRSVYRRDHWWFILYKLH